MRPLVSKLSPTTQRFWLLLNDHDPTSLVVSECVCLYKKPVRPDGIAVTNAAAPAKLAVSTMTRARDNWIAFFSVNMAVSAGVTAKAELIKVSALSRCVPESRRPSSEVLGVPYVGTPSTSKLYVMPLHQFSANVNSA